MPAMRIALSVFVTSSPTSATFNRAPISSNSRSINARSTSLKISCGTILAFSALVSTSGTLHRPSSLSVFSNNSVPTSPSFSAAPKSVTKPTNKKSRVSPTTSSPAKPTKLSPSFAANSLPPLPLLLFLPASPPRPPLADLATLALPYDFYTDNDLAHRAIYVEASRGCPYECEFCLSALDETVRQFPLDRFLAAMQRLLDRGCRQFKFVDRTFNLDLKTSAAILQFFLDRYQPGLFLHFEMIPDRLPESLRVLIQKFPPASLQFEVGIQTFNEEVARRISRRQNNAKAEENLRWLRAHTGVHIHADLIVGLPGESLDSFAAGFDRLVAIEPHEIQVGILKRLRGAPIARHTAQWQMIYDPQPPYEILQNRDLDFATMQRLRRFARYWDLIANSGRFVETAPLIWKNSSPFREFLAFSDWLYTETRSTHGIALPRLARLLEEYLREKKEVSDISASATHSQAAGPRARQARHLAGASDDAG